MFAGRPVSTWYDSELERLNRQCLPPERIAERFHLAPVQIYAALTYYDDHQEAIDREISAEHAGIAAHARADQSPLAQRIRQAAQDWHAL